MIDETFSLTWKFPENISRFLFGRLFKSVNSLGGHPVYASVQKEFKKNLHFKDTV